MYNKATRGEKNEPISASAVIQAEAVAVEAAAKAALAIASPC
jgi:hypothetical protein